MAASVKCSFIGVQISNIENLQPFHERRESDFHLVFAAFFTLEIKLGWLIPGEGSCEITI